MENIFCVEKKDRCTQENQNRVDINCGGILENFKSVENKNTDRPKNEQSLIFKVHCYRYQQTVETLNGPSGLLVNANPLSYTFLTSKTCNFKLGRLPIFEHCTTPKGFQ